MGQDHLGFFGVDGKNPALDFPTRLEHLFRFVEGDVGQVEVGYEAGDASCHLDDGARTVELLHRASDDLT